MDRETVRRIREAVRQGILRPAFKAADVNLALGIGWAGTFLPKHRVSNPGGYTAHFVRIDRGMYRLK